MDVSNNSKPCHGQIKIRFETADIASLVKQCMEVDDELQPGRLLKQMTLEGQTLVVSFQGADLKILRVGISSFFDMVTVAAKTILEFSE